MAVYFCGNIKLLWSKSGFLDFILSKCQCGFRRGYNEQHCLITLTEKWKKSVDNGWVFSALFTDLSKVFDCLSHEILITKLDAYGFHKNTLKLVNSYLSNRKQRVKINDKYSSWSEILSGVPHFIVQHFHKWHVLLCRRLWYRQFFFVKIFFYSPLKI